MVGPSDCDGRDQGNKGKKGKAKGKKGKAKTATGAEDNEPALVQRLVAGGRTTVAEAYRMRAALLERGLLTESTPQPAGGQPELEEVDADRARMKAPDVSSIPRPSVASVAPTLGSDASSTFECIISKEAWLTSEGVPAEEAAEEAAEEPPKRQRLSWRCPVVGGGGDSITDSYSAAAARGLAARVLAKRQTVDQTDLVQKVVDQHVASWWQHELMKGLEAEEASSPSFGMCEELASSPEPCRQRSWWTPKRIRKLEAFGLAVADAVANIATSRFCTSVTSAATSVTGPGVDPPHQSHQPHHQAEATVRVDPEHQPHPFVQLKQADGYKSVVVFSKIIRSVRKNQLGKIPDGTVCRIDEIDKDSASFRISHADWNGWIASRNATSVTGVDPLAESSSAS